MRKGFIGVDAVDIRGDQIKLEYPTFIKFDDIIKYQVKGFPTKPGEDIKQITYHIWTAHGEHYTITGTDYAFNFMKAVTE